jgi:hypothetical protein
MARVPRRVRSVRTVASPAPPGGSALSIRDLKDLVLARFPEDHPLRAVILAEKDVLTPAELLAKMEVWAVLLNRRA